MPNDKPKGWLGGGIPPLHLAVRVGASGVWLIQRRPSGRVNFIAPWLLLVAGVGVGALRLCASRGPQNFRHQPPSSLQKQQLSPPRQVGRQPRPATRLLVSGEPLPVDADDLHSEWGWWPLEEHFVGHGSSDSPIFTFVSQFAPEKEQGLFGGEEEGACNRNEAAALPSPATAADIEFLRGLDLEGLLAATGPADVPLWRFMVSPAVAEAASGAINEEGKHPAYDENNPPTPATLVADLKASANFKSAIVDLDDDGSGGPLPYLGYLVFDNADEVHEDETNQYVFSTPEDVAEVNADRAAGKELNYWDKRVFRSRAQLAALKRYVLQERVFFVLVHMVRTTEHTFEPRARDVLLMALGVSVATGNLVGVMAIQACHNLCD